MFPRQLSSALSLRVLICAAVLCATAIVYLPSLRAPFIFDDIPHIAENLDMRLGVVDQLKLAFGTLKFFDRPVPILSLGINYAISGSDTLSYHLFNVCFHLAVVLLMMLVWCELAGCAGWAGLIGLAAAGLLFGLNPLATETVCYSWNRAGSLVTLFCLLSLWGYIRFRRTGLRRYLWGSVVALVLGMMSKEAAAALPIAVCAYELVYHDRPRDWRRALRIFAPAAMLCLVVAVFALVYLLSVRMGFSHDQASMPWQGVSYQIVHVWVQAHFWSMFLAPHGQTIYHLFHPDCAAQAGRILLGAAGFLVVIGGVVGAYKSKPTPLRRALLFGCIWWLAFQLPTAIFKVHLAERQIYLPGIGLAWMLAALLAGLAGRARAVLLWAVCAGLLMYAGLLGAATFQRSRMYADPVTLWREAVVRYPFNWISWNNLGSVYQMKGENAKAAVYFRIATQKNPGFALGWINLANTEINRGRWAQAEKALLSLIAHCPALPDGYSTLGDLYARLNMWDDAAAQYQAALKLAPENIGLVVNAVVAEMKRSRLDDAERILERVLRSRPQDPRVMAVHARVRWARGDRAGAADGFRALLRAQPGNREAMSDLGVVLMEAGKINEAVRVLGEAVRLAPNSAREWYVLGVALTKQGDTAGADAAYRRSFSIDPRQAEAANNTGISLWSSGKLAQAREALAAAIAARPQWAVPYENMGNLLMVMGRRSEALACLDRALQLDPANTALRAGLERVRARDAASRDRQ